MKLLALVSAKILTDVPIVSLDMKTSMILLCDHFDLRMLGYIKRHVKAKSITAIRN